MIIKSYFKSDSTFTIKHHHVPQASGSIDEHKLNILWSTLSSLPSFSCFFLSSLLFQIIELTTQYCSSLIVTLVGSKSAGIHWVHKDQNSR